MDKRFLLEQLGAKLRTAVQTAHKASTDAREDARSGAARAVNLALGHGQRSVASREALDALDAFQARPLRREDGASGRTLFIAPVGAGEELTGPDGDGVFQVVTPHSPFGRALMGKRVGDVVDVPVPGEPAEWTIVYAA
jgi:hypothetical protein